VLSILVEYGQLSAGRFAVNEKAASLSLLARCVRLRAADAACPPTRVLLGQIAESHLARRRGQLLLKRIIDVAGASFLLLALMPLLLLVGVAIRFDSPGPALFRQKRYGLNGQSIEIYKFRTMVHAGADVSGVRQAVRDDPRVTRLGALLRTTNVDELPQLLNVIRGDMSLVGPRPHPIGMKAASLPYEEYVGVYHLRHLMRPGMTGLAQSRNYRGPTVRPIQARARITADLAYVTRFNLAWDFAIALRTVISELKRCKGL
jgi:polysaccharide biosynthesis protein PslA